MGTTSVSVLVIALLVEKQSGDLLPLILETRTVWSVIGCFRELVVWASQL